MSSSAGDSGTGFPHLPSFPERQSIREQVAQALRASLVAGRMRPGVVYSAPALAAQFGVSATPVREAMLDLAKEGLVEVIRNKGFRVTELSDTELDEISKVRELIEVPTVAQIAGLCDKEMKPRLEGLREIAKQIEDGAAQGRLIEYVELDRRFHLELLALAGNNHLVTIVGDLRARSRLYGLQELVDRRELTESAREHEEILDLVLAGNSEAAGDLMRRHIGHVRGSWASGRNS